MKKINFKKILSVTTLCFGLSNFAVAQCHANYTYIVGNSGSVNFTNTSTGTTGTPSYNWNFGDGTSSNTASPTHTYPYNGTYYTNLFISDTTGHCGDSISQAITITNGLTCNIAAGFSYSTGSAGQINFTNTTANAPSGVIYSWTFGDGGNSNQTSPSHTYNYNSSYTISLVVSDSSGACSNTTSQTFTISNADTCNLHVSYTYTLASNGLVYFTSTSTGVDSSATINWSFGNNNSSYNQLHTSNTYAYNGTYYATLHIGDSTSVCYGNHTDTIIITTATAPSCGAHFTDSLVSNGTVLFANQSFGTTANTNYYWNFGFGGATSSSINPSFTYTTNGVYLVNLSITDSSTGCSSTYIDSVIITNAAPSCLPTVSFIIYKDSLNQQSGVWQISPNYSSQVTNAVWSWGDGSSTIGFYPMHTYAVAGFYSVCVTVFSACGDSSTTCQNDSITNSSNSIIQVTVVNATTGIKNNSQETAQLSLYPNPSTGVVTLNLMYVLATKAQINITNILGEVVYSAQEQVNNSLTKAIDLQNIENGAYFMKVIVGEKSYINKIIINK